MSGQQDAAAMDALNLDDLFLGGDDDNQGGMGDALFADMDIDLGDIMDGIIGDGAAPPSASDGGGMGNLMDDFFASTGSDGGGPTIKPPARSRSNSISADIIPAPSKGKGKSRTARSNPFLAMAQQQQQQSSITKKQSAVSSEAKMLMSSSLLSANQILSPTAKRKRRKSKKLVNMDEDDDCVRNDYGGGPNQSSSSIVAQTKKSRRTSGGSRNRSKITPNLDRDISQSSMQQDRSSSSSSILPPPLIQQQERASSYSSSINLQHPTSSLSSIQPNQLLKSTSSSSTTTTITPTGPTLEQIRQTKKLLQKKAQQEVSKFGLDQSRTLFFPYMHLPQEVDVKKRGQKAYPSLEKLNIQSAILGHNGAQDGISNTKEQEEEQKSSSSSNNNSTITTTSPIYTLFDRHIGALTDNHGQLHPSATLLSSLDNSTDTVSSHLKKMTRNKKRQLQLNLPQSILSQSQPLIEELSKLYVGCIKQSAFLRQNLMNMEGWCTDHLSREDVSATFDVKRKHVENVLRMMQLHKRQQEKQTLMEEKRQKMIQMQGVAVQVVAKGTKKMVASDKLALPAPEVNLSTGLQSLPNAPNHGGIHSTPIIALKVKVKVSGWRDKSGARLGARMWCPNGWKVALKRSQNSLNGPSGSSSGIASTLISNKPAPRALAPLDLSSVDRATMEVVANEILRFDLMPPKKLASPPPPPAVVKEVAKEIMEPLKPPAKSSTPPSGGVDAAPEVKKGNNAAAPAQVAKETKKSRKRKAKESVASSVASPSSTATTPNSSSKRGGPEMRRLMPHVPSLDKPRFHTAILTPSTIPSLSSSNTTNEKKKEDDIYTQEQTRLLNHLYTQILHPALSPTERRSHLANEISSTLTRLENYRQSKSNPNIVKIQKQVEELQSIYEEDLDIVPEHGNTIGMWNWMKANNYWEEGLEREEDVYLGLEGIWQPELMLEEEDMDVGGGVVGCGDWGLMLPSPGKVSSSTDVVKVDNEKDGVVVECSSSEKKEFSPLFDRLQSLLVEEDDGSDDDDTLGDDEDDDDYLIASLPPFSPEEFIHGPNKDKPSMIVAPGDTPDDAMLDVSALTLDQRTYIQLRAAGLIDASTPFYDDLPQPSPSHSKPITVTSDDNDQESIESILTKMKSRLSTLHVENNANVATLQRKALSHVTSPTNNKLRQKKLSADNDEATLQKYKHFQNLQKEQKEEKQRQIRTSARVKTGSNKFDGEQWLPW